MGGPAVKIGVLTSSRADFGIYLPLIRQLHRDPYFDLHLIAFGSHLSEKYGKTINHILDEGFSVSHQIEVMPKDDTPGAIVEAMGKNMEMFADLWKHESFDIVLALGDRFEMFAAVASGVPFNIKFGHIHGGETTKGAVDDAFRNAITHMSIVHFTCTDEYRQRVVQLTGNEMHVYNTGSLSLDYLRQTNLLTKEEFLEKYGIDLSKPTILTTFHPETVSFENNRRHAEELIDTLDQLTRYQIIITMPNADTTGLMIREKLEQFASRKPDIILRENFGSLGYLSCMKYCNFLLGNTSSGFFDASFFPKWVINLGTRQQGRVLTPNIISCDFNRDQIIQAVKLIESSGNPTYSNVYGNGDAVEKIIKILKNERF